MSKPKVTPYGCNNSERHSWYRAPDRVRVIHGKDGKDFAIGTVFIEDTSTKDCQYRKSTPNDPRCKGCLK